MSKPRVKPPVKMVGEDGNAFAILARCQRAARRAGWTREQIDEFMDEAKSGDYTHLLGTVTEHFNVDADEPEYREDVKPDASRPARSRTPKDHVDILFQALKEDGFDVIEGTICCSTCAGAELGSRAEDGTPVAFYHEQNIEGRNLEDRYSRVYVGYFRVRGDTEDWDTDAEQAKTRKVGERIVEIAEDLEVPVEWDGSYATKILVNP
jgi:hypothetical protein